MLISDSSAPTFEELRPLKSPSTATFPVYKDLVTRLVGGTAHPDDAVAHVMGTCAGYAYAKSQTVAMMMARMGLEGNRCRMVAQYVDAMFICSTSFLVQSADGRVVILAYRGTEPANGINWLTDADVHPDKIAIPFSTGGTTYAGHGAITRNRPRRWAALWGSSNHRWGSSPGSSNGCGTSSSSTRWMTTRLSTMSRA